MDKNRNKPKSVQTVQSQSLHNQLAYTSPDIEIIDIELEQNILGGSVPNQPPVVWP